MGSFTRPFSGRFWALIAATFLGFLGIGTVLPAMAPHVRHDLGGSDQTVGLVIGVFSFVALAARFVSGPVADRRGPKTAFLSGLVSSLPPLHEVARNAGIDLPEFLGKLSRGGAPVPEAKPPAGGAK